LDHIVSKGILNNSIEVHKQWIKEALFNLFHQWVIAGPEFVLYLLYLPHHMFDHTHGILIERKLYKMLRCNTINSGSEVDWEEVNYFLDKVGGVVVESQFGKTATDLLHGKLVLFLMSKQGH
jgi:hypothetical protein